MDGRALSGGVLEALRQERGEHEADAQACQELQEGEKVSDVLFWSWSSRSLAQSVTMKMNNFPLERERVQGNYTTQVSIDHKKCPFVSNTNILPKLKL